MGLLAYTYLLSRHFIFFNVLCTSCLKYKSRNKKVLFDLGVTQAKTRWPGKLIEKIVKACETKHMDWKRQHQGDSPPSIEDK